MSGNAWGSRHSLADTHRHLPGTASSVVATNSGGTAIEELVATDAATASTVVKRDANSRFKAAAPSAATDVAIKSYVEGLAYLVANLPGILREAIKIHKYTITTADMTDSDTSQTVDLSTDDDANSFPASAIVLAGGAALVTPVSGGTISECLIRMGDAGAAEELLADITCFTGATPGLIGTVIAFLTAEAAYSPQAVLTFTGGNADTAEDGEIVCFILLLDMTALATLLIA